MDVAQVTLMGNDLMALPEAVNMSRRTVRMIWQNLFWAFIYNLVCIPLAAGALYLFGINFQITPMCDWSTVFVEVPIETFNPVKTVNDLLRPQHQPAE